MVQVEEDVNFNVSAGFMLPDFGYTGQAMREVPQGLHDYIKPYENTGLCKLVVNKDSSGAWTYQQAPPLTDSSLDDILPTKDEGQWNVVALSLLEAGFVSEGRPC